MLANGIGFDPLRAGVARAFFVGDTAAEKAAAIERRMTAQQRIHAISQRPHGSNTASIMAFSDTRETNEEATRSAPGRDLPQAGTPTVRERRIYPAERWRNLETEPAAGRHRDHAEFSERGVVPRRRRGVTPATDRIASVTGEPGGLRQYQLALKSTLRRRHARKASLHGLPLRIRVVARGLFAYRDNGN